MTGLPHESFSLIQSAFTFDNIPGMDTKVRLFRDLRALLKPDGIIVNIVSAPEIYCNEWASFSTKDFPENRDCQAGRSRENHYDGFRGSVACRGHSLAPRVLPRSLFPRRA